MNKLLHISIIFLSLLLASCGKDEDYASESETSFSFTYPTDNSKGYVKVLQQHTKGNGFPIIIMADGYLQSDITSGTYHNVVSNAVNALFAVEPMTSLKAYFDIYEVQAASEVCGITTTQRNTAFSTYFESATGVLIMGDNTKIENYAWYTLKKNYSKFHNALVIMLVNSTRYGGVTLLATNYSSTDSIPGGFSLAYVPTGCKVNNVSYFTQVLQHEAIGHGIGKLADEYTEEYYTPSQEVIDKYLNLQKNGLYINTKYDADTENPVVEGTLRRTSGGTVTKYVIGGHTMQPGDIGYLFACDAGYSNEELVWIQGGYTYLTPSTTLYTGDNTNYLGWYTTEKNFYRPTWRSLMNDVIEQDSKTFNALSRYIIYCRVLKVAQGSPGNIHNEQLQRRFMQFDTMRSYSSAAKGAAPHARSIKEISTEQTPPALPAPKLIEKITLD